MNQVTYEILTQRIKQLGNLPAMPAVLSTLTEALSVPASNIDLEKVVGCISHDKSLAAQCLRLANSALFRQRGDVQSVRDAVLALGFWRIRDLAFSCSMPLLFANAKAAIARDVFWRHALGTAVLSQGLSRDFGTVSQDDAYLCGLLHDIGVLVNSLLFPDDFQDVLEAAMVERLPIEDLEQQILGFTHAESGKVLAEKWRLPLLCTEVIEHHIGPTSEGVAGEISMIVHTADLFCQQCGLGYGYELQNAGTSSLEEIWNVFATHLMRAGAVSASLALPKIMDSVHEAQLLADRVFHDSRVMA